VGEGTSDPDVARGRELLALVSEGAIDGLSIGYRTVRGQIDPRTRVRKLYQVDLWEVSIVTFPLLAGARVRAVKEARRSAGLCFRYCGGAPMIRYGDLYNAHQHARFMRPDASLESSGCSEVAEAAASR
jgi:hypothetical protein